MKKLVNIRIPLLCVLGLIVGIVSFHELLFGNFWPLLVFGVVVIVFGIVLACLKSKFWICCIIVLIFVGIGFFNFKLRYNYADQNSNASQDGVLSGRVTDIERNGKLSNVLYLEDCTFEDKSVKGVVKITTYNGAYYSTGDRVTFKGTLRNSYSIKDTIDSFDIRYKINYELTDGTSLKIEHGELTVDEKVRLYIYNVAKEYMPTNADVAYALITGDRNALDETKTEAFQAAGIIHLLVVSGLHVNFVVLIFGFLLQKLKIKEYIQLPILLVPLLFYAYICNYTPSIMRAIIMTVCLYLSRILHGRYDLLTSLFWAMTVILLLQPAYLYDIGFQLSSMSVFGIATVYLRINRALTHRKINRFLRRFISSVALSFSCVVATLFFNAYYFSSVALLGILINVIAIPMIFVSFVLTVVGLVPWVFHYAAWLSDKIIYAVVYVAKSISGLNVVLPIEAISAAMVITPILLYLVGGYVRLPKLPYWISTAVCSVLLVFCMVVQYIPKKCDNCVKVFFGYGDTIVVSTSNEGNAILLGEFDDEYVLKQALTYLGGKNINSVEVFSTHFNSCDNELLADIANTVKLSAIYKLDFSGNPTVENAFDKNLSIIQVLPNSVQGNDITVQSVYDGGLIGVVINIGNINVTLVTAQGVKASYFTNLRQDSDYYIVNDEIETYSDKNFATLSFYQNDLKGNFGANKYGNFTITEKDDTILLTFRRN